MLFLDLVEFRNLFFRVSSLSLMGIKLVFVMEGTAPKLKAETMSKRTKARYGQFKNPTKCSTNTSRGRFNSILKEVSHPVSLSDVFAEHHTPFSFI